VKSESYEYVYPLLAYLKERGLMPRTITMDGHRYVMKAVRDIWPHSRIQRCLFHICREGQRWLRTYPKTDAAKHLKYLLSSLMAIKTNTEKRLFLGTYHRWHRRYHSFIKALPKESIANKDLQRTVRLIDNALPDMFRYLNDHVIAATTNYLEGLYSQIKHHYRSHRGLTEKHKQSFLRWFCYLKNQQISNTF
jgi:putative transposase